MQRVVLIDVTRLVGRLLDGRLPTGVDRVSLEYVRHFYGRSQAIVRYRGRWLELTLTDSRRVFDVLLSPTPPFKLRIRILITKAWWLNFLPARHQQKLLLETGHHGLEQSGYLKQLSKLELRPIFFIHDLIPLIHPEYCREGEAERHRVRMDTALQFGHGVVVNSQATLSDLSTYAKNTKQSMPPMVAAKLAAAVLPGPSVISLIDAPYFVMLGTIEPRKNHWMILQVWRRLIEQLGSAAPKLVIIGQRGWDCENVVDLLDRCEILRDFVLERPACSDADLATYLCHAQALLFPSFSEGYGMPLVESLALGTPVIASDLDVFHEIAGEIPDYLDPLDGLGWLAKIQEFSLPNSVLRLDQLDRIKAFEAPSWTTHFEIVDKFINGIS
ncbi:glycosyltransferase family 1 protein [Methylotenera sp.]|uniref:glycosyltransferase family 4 protein n=1 Tax=Methylotenera sp. TaxID=2051956 RepID=UPI0024882748|nr:glycosyltransferase family 1 protein [Methylotenera sp.]MDI1298696.1 glycosyltransferase family 1 protein [Methylotenera sp.]